MSELLAPVEEPPRICGHDALKNGGCKGKVIDKVKPKDYPIGAAIKQWREVDKRKKQALKKTREPPPPLPPPKTKPSKQQKTAANEQRIRDAQEVRSKMFTTRHCIHHEAAPFGMGSCMQDGCPASPNCTHGAAHELPRDKLSGTNYQTFTCIQ